MCKSQRLKAASPAVEQYCSLSHATVTDMSLSNYKLSNTKEIGRK